MSIYIVHHRRKKPLMCFNNSITEHEQKAICKALAYFLDELLNALYNMFIELRRLDCGFSHLGHFCSWNRQLLVVQWAQLQKYM